MHLTLLALVFWPALCTATEFPDSSLTAQVRQALGIAVFAGMLGVTLFGLFLTPVFYVALRKLAGPLDRGHGSTMEGESNPEGESHPRQGDEPA